jgi:hypothetical protein
VDKNQLLESAKVFASRTASISGVLEGKVELCAAELTAALNARPDLEELIGAGNMSVMEMNHINHFRYMNSLVALYDPKSFVETVLWVFRTYRARGFSVQYWEIMLPEAIIILRQHLGDVDYHEMGPYYEWLRDNIQTFARLSETELSVFEELGGKDGSHG